MKLFNRKENKTEEREDNKDNEYEYRGNSIRDERLYYIIRILIPVSSNQCDYTTFYKGENDLLVPDMRRAKRYDDFETARIESVNMMKEYQNIKIWAPTYVLTKTINKQTDNQ